jgi:erythromycin esterase
VTRQLHDLPPPSRGDLEDILHIAGEHAIFVDLRHQQPAPGNAWMFQELAAREDVAAPPTRLIPHDQFDGLILIETLSPPQYID